MPRDGLVYVHLPHQRPPVAGHCLVPRGGVVTHLLLHPSLPVVMVTTVIRFPFKKCKINSKMGARNTPQQHAGGGDKGLAPTPIKCRLVKQRVP